MLKRPRSHEVRGDNNSFIPKKRHRNTIEKHQKYESQDIWKNLEKIRTQYKNAEQIIKNSLIIIPVVLNNSLTKDVLQQQCIAELHQFVSANKLQIWHSATYAHIILREFHMLDCCLVLAAFFAWHNDMSNDKRLFTVPPNTLLFGTFYLPATCKIPSNNTYGNVLRPIELGNLPSFIQFSINSPSALSLPKFMACIMQLLINVKYHNSPKQIEPLIKRFKKEYLNSQQTLKFTLGSLPLKTTALFDLSSFINTNQRLIRETEDNLKQYLDKLLQSDQESSSKSNLQTPSTIKGPTKQTATSRYSARNSNTRKVMQNENTPTHTNYSASNNGSTNRPGFLTQEQIKEHCIATLKSATDIVKTKSPYQITKIYVKCPRLNYIDIVYQNLDNLRSQTNCNIVVLNLNNIHESQNWFNALDVSKYTAVTSQPHVSNVKVISIGGVGEHVIKALDLIKRIMTS